MSDDEEQSDKENRINTRRSWMEIEDDDRHMDKTRKSAIYIYCAKREDKALSSSSSSSSSSFHHSISSLQGTSRSQSSVCLLSVIPSVFPSTCEVLESHRLSFVHFLLSPTPIATLGFVKHVSIHSEREGILSCLISRKSMNIWWCAFILATYRPHPFQEYWRELDAARSVVCSHCWLIDFEQLHNGKDVDEMNDEYQGLRRVGCERFDRRSRPSNSSPLDSQYRKGNANVQLAEPDRRHM